ncbi:hypothetical protein RUM44_012030 [Polyplax serrata]|uniref:Uncharacterized protein n=1 Tax=Polyplax serrata TaxID=468196 RepID=A0ABR1BF30_POLSC
METALTMWGTVAGLAMPGRRWRNAPEVWNVRQSCENFTGKRPSMRQVVRQYPTRISGLIREYYNAKRQKVRRQIPTGMLQRQVKLPLKRTKFCSGCDIFSK